jgi:hypothetical protein
MKYINFLICIFTAAALIFPAFIFFAALPAGAFDLECEDRPLREVLRIIADELKVNIIADPKITDIKVSFALRDISAEEALDLILKTNQLAFNRETANTYTVFKISDSHKYMDLNSCVFKINYAAPQKVAESLQLLYPRVGFTADNSNGTIFAAGNFSDEDIAVIKSKIKLLDEAPLRIKINYEVLKIADSRVAESVLKLHETGYKNFAAASLHAINDIISHSRSLTKAVITLMPSEKESVIESVTKIPYFVNYGSGEVGVAESSAGDIFEVRAISATKDGALLEFSVNASKFIDAPAHSQTHAAPPASYSQRLKSVISVKNGERVLAGQLSNEGFTKIISSNAENIFHSRNNNENTGGKRVFNIIKSAGTNRESVYIYLQAQID